MHDINAQTFRKLFDRIFKPHKQDPAESCGNFFASQKEEQLNQSLCEDDSGVSSASSTTECDDIANSEDLIKIAEAQKAELEAEENDYKERYKKEEETYTDEFEDVVVNELIERLPDGLREVIIQMRETTNADIRDRHKHQRITRVVRATDVNNRKKTEIRAAICGERPPVFVNGPLNPPIIHSHHPCVDLGGLKRPLRIYPWKLKRKTPPIESQPENNSNILVIDNTNVTLRKKGTSQINEDDDANVTSIAADQKIAENKILDESEELKEFNTHNFWHISPGIIDELLDELSGLRSPPKPEGNAS